MNRKEQAERLLEYFRDLPEDRIFQGIGHSYIGMEEKPMCFGAHVSKALGIEACCDDSAKVCHVDGARAFGELITEVSGRNQAPIFMEHGVAAPYGVEGWERKPYDVLCDIFDDIGLVPKEVHDFPEDELELEPEEEPVPA